MNKSLNASKLVSLALNEETVEKINHLAKLKNMSLEDCLTFLVEGEMSPIPE